MKKLPIGIQTFSELIEENYVYVDKTAYIYQLLQGKYYFLSRPRRFGKSLLLSTLKELFSGNRELFQGLWIYHQITWEEYPVIHLDFSSITNSEGREEFKKNIKIFLSELAGEYDLSLSNTEPKELLRELTSKLYEKYNRKVVLLIDEYDKPIIDHIENSEKARENKELLASFYETIKYLDKNLKFVFITGVSKFSKVSVFSRLNNLLDITIDEKFAALAGYTQNDLENYFADHLNLLCGKTQIPKAEILSKIKKWYNGYSWNEGQNTVYNPFGILNLFYKNRFANYWFGTATPTFLIKLIKAQKVAIEDFEAYQTGVEIFDSFELESLDPVALLFQTGYLTIKKERNRIVTFGYPNFEVKESFLVHLLASYTNLLASRIKPFYLGMLDCLAAEEINKFQTTLVALFAGIPYHLHLPDEKYYHSLSYLILALLGAKITLEENTDKGRIDAVLELESLVYIIEFKMDQAAEALQQIKQKQYYQKYLKDPRKVILLGVGGFRKKQIEVLQEEIPLW